MKRVPALLSFFLPGLGQLSQKRYAAAVGFFLAFALATALLQAWWVVPLTALAAGVETLRLPGPGRVEDPRLRWAYGLVGGVGFLAWFGYVAAYFLPVRSQMAVNEDVSSIRSVFRQCHALHAQSAEVMLGCLKASRASQLRDPWNSPYRLSLVEGIFEIRSSGPDGRDATGDDLVYRSHLREERGVQ